MISLAEAENFGVPTSITDIDRYSKEIVGSGANLTWTDLSMTSTKNQHSQKILKSCTGISYTNEIFAIMGASGGGKTTLVTLLADQFLNQEQMEFTGKVYLNDVNLSRNDFSQYVKFVNQSDILMPTLTARESMSFSALLQCVGSSTEIEEYVSKIILEMNIEKFADSLIGDTMIKGISGGEKKLVSIANEMISQPSVLILDEPTSGLDSFNALRVMKVLKQQAFLGKNIILTIHQPSSAIYDMLDRLLILSGGNCVYQGKAMDAYRYFAMMDYLCPNDINPVDFFAKITHIKNFQNMSEEEKIRLKDLKKNYKIQQKPKIEQQIQVQFRDAKGLDRKMILPSKSRKIFTLIQRAFKNSKRHPFLFTLRIVQAIFLSALNAIIYNNIGQDQKSVQNRNGLLFYILDCVCMLSTQVQLLAMQTERYLYIKEIKQGYYGILQYFFSKLIAEIPVQLLFTFLFCIIQYYAVPLNTENSSKILIFMGINLLTHMNGAALGYFAGGISNSSQEALILGGAIGVPLMMFGGFFSNKDSIPKAMSWLKFLSPFSYGFDALAINEYDGLQLDQNINPLEQLSITGDLSSKVASLLGLEILYILITVTALKIKELWRYKKRALN